MKLTLDLPPKLAAALADEADYQGTDPASVALDALDEYLYDEDGEGAEADEDDEDDSTDDAVKMLPDRPTK